MSIYNTNILQLISDTFPKEERTVENLQATLGFMSGAEYSDNCFQDVKQGADLYSFAQVWIIGFYTHLQRVIYLNTGEVYEVDNPNGTSSEPTTSTDWRKVQDSFIGIDESIKFNGTKTVLEYALNRRFLTAFVQPGAGVSDIYISTIGAGISSFIVGGVPANSSKVFLNSSSEYVINSMIFGTPFDFTIYVPIGLATFLGAEYENVLRKFADQYIVYGLKYLVQIY